MEAEELRIGNYVQDIHQPDLVLYTEVDGYLLTEIVDELEPIELTEEWLINFGFEKEQEYDEGGVMDYRFKLQSGTLEFVSFWSSENLIGVNQCQTGLDVHYVHQLQNLYFTLRGEELNIR